ncbi:pimeloyl-ACP methyl ester carboxylesterase [Kitasatospora gansuensis]|uniref:Pimeloyl-ACP methyl ester carboxylesterase n=1 Tax=Kitasatospora gansuensis TaxID=258050 RepID=A0A7W7S9B1_9ACTN|nr:alpha/beta hydrolase-fold protein [Kitasatospora gansuensis]MBB4945266.1 pimeloyl-ACP methyl ester carboxylesterase [Kitasatospora gansuensis]
MNLTDTPVLILTIVLFVASLALAMAQWGGRGILRGRVRTAEQRRGPLRALSYLGTVLLCQVTAVAMVFVVVNNENLIYDSWGDLLGTSNHVRAVPVPPKDGGLSGDQAAASGSPVPKVVQSFHAPDSDAVPRSVKQTDLKGRLSGVDGEVLVWTPPQYDDPAHKDRTFPVVELLAGYPGASSTWFGTMDVIAQLEPLMKSGQVAPFILVSPRVTLLGGTDTGCADIPGKVNAETWLSRDVPQMILDNFRADRTADRWALAGYSAGAHCATRLALAHPDRYRAAISMSGYNDPIGEPSSLTAKDPKLRETSNPLYLLTHAATPPNVALYQTGKKGDGLEDATALQRAAKSPTTVTPVETTGAHLTSTWKPLVGPSFKWLTGIIPAR